MPGITAQGVAEAHVMDLKIQKEFRCSCMTYWIDEDNDSAFCLIEAPSENAVRDLHKSSHGLMPHHIIEVNRDTVASFLGRLYDPVVPGLRKEELKVFNDPAYRTLVIIDIKDPVLLKKHSSRDSVETLLQLYFDVIKEQSTFFGGEIAEHSEPVTSILCFSSSSNALSCGLEIDNAFSIEEKKVLGLKISLTSGMPVSTSDRIFGETIDNGIQLLYTSRDHKVVIGPSTDVISRTHLDKNSERLIFFTLNEEKRLNKIFYILERFSPDESFGIEDFCREVGLSKSSLNRHLHTLTKRSPNTLLKEFRLNKALRLLRKGQNISDVSFSTGFRSPSYFSKCFKEHFLLSPSKFVEDF